MNDIKEQLYTRCLEHIDGRIAAAGDAINAARDASVNDSKSSAGDKYETTREMMQQEISRNEQQLAEAMKLKIFLERLPRSGGQPVAGPGSLVFTDQGNFYLAIGAGQIIADDVTYFAVSVSSPLGQALNGKRAGEKVVFNGKRFGIGEVV